jgi:hypothetical protein
MRRLYPLRDINHHASVESALNARACQGLFLRDTSPGSMA